MKKLTACEFPLVQAIVAACVVAGCQTTPVVSPEVSVTQTRVCVVAALTKVDASAYGGCGCVQPVRRRLRDEGDGAV